MKTKRKGNDVLISQTPQCHRPNPSQPGNSPPFPPGSELRREGDYNFPWLEHIIQPMQNTTGRKVAVTSGLAILILVAIGGDLPGQKVEV